MTSSARPVRRRELAAPDLDLDRLARPALALVVVVSGLLMYHLNRGSSFSPDEWSWIVTRRSDTLGTFLAPYNGHLSLVPIAIYRLMFALFGIGDFAPYRVLLLVVASATGVVIFEYARHRVGEFCALLVATLLMFPGPGWNIVIQPFQIAWLIAVSSGILAFSLLDFHRTRADVAACLLILIAISSQSLGVAFAVGIAVEIALTRRRWSDAWIVGLPLLLYAAWAVHYHPASIQVSSATQAPLNLAQTTAEALAGLLGLSGVTFADLTGLGVTFGAPLLALAVATVIVRARKGWDWTRFLSLAVVLVTFSLMTTLVRSFQSPLESRYMYVTGVVVALMVLELARGVNVPPRVQLVLAALTLFAVISNVGILRGGGTYFGQLGARTDATLTAIELDRDRVAPDTQLTQLPLYPFAAVSAGQYFTVEHSLGTPAYTIAQLRRASPAVQGVVDAQLLSDGEVGLAGVAHPPPPRGAPAAVEGVEGGTAVGRGACLQFAPAAALEPGQGSALTLGLTPGRVSVTAGGAPVTLSVRRFAPTFTALGTVQTNGSAIVSVSNGRAPQPWNLQLQSAVPVRVCTLGGT